MIPALPIPLDPTEWYLYFKEADQRLASYLNPKRKVKLGAYLLAQQNPNRVLIGEHPFPNRPFHGLPVLYQGAPHKMALRTGPTMVMTLRTDKDELVWSVSFFPEGDPLLLTPYLNGEEISFREWACRNLGGSDLALRVI